MYEVRPFELVFLLVASEECSEAVARRTWEEGINVKGLLNFLDRPLSIRFTRQGRD
jgi:hypothetical protein